MQYSKRHCSVACRGRNFKASLFLYMYSYKITIHHIYNASPSNNVIVGAYEPTKQTIRIEGDATTMSFHQHYVCIDPYIYVMRRGNTFGIAQLFSHEKLCHSTFLRYFPFILVVGVMQCACCRRTACVVFGP